MHRIRRAATAILAPVGLLAAYLTAAASASAVPIEPGGGVQGSLPVPASATPTTTVITTGSPWWTFVLVAVAGAAFAVIASLLITWLRHTKTARIATT